MTSPYPSLAANPNRGQNNYPDVISHDASPVLALLAECPQYKPTPLHDQAELAAQFGVAKLWIKDESTRMNLGSFKALGAAYVVAKMAMDAMAKNANGGDYSTALNGVSVLAASAGNHGLSLAAGARIFGAKATIYLSASVPESFAERLRGIGADVIRHGEVYEESMARALADAEAGKGILISDTSWPEYRDVPYQIMEGYLVMGKEATDALDAAGEAPTHIFLQAGVGGLSSAMARWCRRHYGDAPIIINVEPEDARPLQASLMAGELISVTGGVSVMGRLDCKDASELAFKALSDDADFAQAISERDSEVTTLLLAAHGLKSSPSGIAGISALQHLSDEDRATLGINENSRVLTFMSEGAA